MLGRWDGQIEPFAVVTKINQIGMIAAQNRLFDLLIGFQRPVKAKRFGIVAAPLKQAQIVHDVATANDQHAFATQCSQLFG